jgi:two-component system response regulator MprA
VEESVTACRILVADDDPAIRVTVSEALSDEGYEVVAVADGRSALEALTHNHLTLAILDMRMPGLTGWDVVAEMRARGLRVPVLVMTAAQNARLWAAEVGAEDYLAKPFDLYDLLDKVEDLCTG